MRRAALGLLAALLGAGAAPAATVAEEAAVRANFAGLKGALAKRDAAALLGLASGDSRAYCQELLALAGRGSSEELARLEASDRLAVLALRREVPPEVLRAGDCAGFLRHALGRSAPDPAALAGAELRGFESSDGRARGLLALGGVPTPWVLAFAQTRGAWRLDARSSLELTARLLLLPARLAGVPEDRLVDVLLDAGTSGGEKRAGER